MARCACDGGRTSPCATCGRVICPRCRVKDPLIMGAMYIECMPCAHERKAWNAALRRDKQFMRWHGFKKYSPTPPERKERIPEHV